MSKLIYIADDEKNIRQLIETFLTKEGFQVQGFGDGESLLAAFQQRPADLLILDIMMPGMDGLSLCASIRQTSNVPIIIVSAKDSPLDRVTGITLGLNLWNALVIGVLGLPGFLLLLLTQWVL